MPNVVDTLEQSVNAAVTVIAELRDRVVKLERELAARTADSRPPAVAAPPAPGYPEFAHELERLRAERVVVRERIRGLLGEIDRVCR